jgi:hypothetical membrane protein
MNKWFVFTLIVCLMDCILPFILACFYPGYSHMNMVLSSLGSEQSPVRIVFNIWMACLGVSFIFIGIHLFVTYKVLNPIASTILLIITISYAVFDCILSSLFSVGDSKEMITVGEKIHGYGSAIGCTLFVFAGLLAVILVWKRNPLVGKLLLVNCVISFIVFVVFVAGENIPRDSKGILKIMTYEGLWQRISFIFMYIPYVGLTFVKS